MIRAARPGDADALWEIFQMVVAGRDTYAFPPNTLRAEGVGYWFGDEVTSFVAEVDGRVLGMYKLIPNRRGLGSHVANASFMVHPAARGRGLGYEMGRHCLGEARRQGYDAMQFNFVVSSNVRGVALWQRLGFTVVGTLPKAFRHGTLGFVDAYVMHRSLDDIVPSFGTPPVAGDAVARPSAYAVVENPSGEIAVVRGKSGRMLPGGGIDGSESGPTTVVREVAEECALHIRVRGELGDAVQFVASPDAGVTFAKHSHFFSATAESPIEGVRSEHLTGWLTADEAAAAVTFESHAWAIRRWVRLNS